jgi:hypothetical protein
LIRWSTSSRSPSADEKTDVVAPCGELAPKPERNVPKLRSRAVKPAASEQLEQPPRLRRAGLIRGGPQLTKCCDRQSHLRQMGSLD